MVAAVARPLIVPRRTPILRRTRGRVAVFNADLWSIAARTGAVVLDQWGSAWIYDWRPWDADRIHLTEEGHRRTALAAATALGVPVAETDWLLPLPPQPARALRAAVSEEVAWRGFVAMDRTAAARPLQRGRPGAEASGPPRPSPDLD